MTWVYSTHSKHDGEGYIPYSITNSTKLELGHEAEFTIAPMHEGFFYAKLKSCKVENHDGSNDFEIYPKCSDFLGVTHDQEMFTQEIKEVYYLIYHKS